MRASISITAGLFFAATAAMAAPAPQPPSAASVPRAGHTETTGITLTLLDVEVRDAQGRPLRGLRKEDFKVKLGLREWPIYSVDDLCTCTDEASATGAGEAGAAGPRSGETTATTTSGAAPTPTGEAPAPASATNTAPGAAGAHDPLRYVVFMDFGALQVNGRAFAFREARRWIREVKHPADEVMIAGYTEQRGLVEVCPFTAEAPRLLEALDRAQADPKLQDSFPSGVASRVADCQEDTGRCLAMCTMDMGEVPEIACGQCFPTGYCQQIARDEYVHGRNSLLGLKDLLVSLESIPGRKALLHFQQNGAVSPGRIYNSRRTQDDNHAHLMDEIGAEANLSRTAIHGAYVGDRLGADKKWEKELADQAVTLASNLADFTGGTYGLDLNALKGLTSDVRRDCACTYRLGLEPPARPDDRVYAAHVEVRGRPQPHAYRVVFLDDADRWLRQAVAVLRNPERVSQLSMGAALVPVRRSEKGGWDVRLQIAFDLDVLAMVPEREARTGSWEAGALLASDDGTRQWELMSISGVRRANRASAPRGDRAVGSEAGPEEPAEDGTGRPTGGAAAAGSVAQSPPSHPGSAVLHERVMEGLPSGRFTLRAFVRDRTSLTIGGAHAVLDLPRAGQDGLSGPVLFQSARRYLLAPLPLFKKTGSSESRITEARTGEIPSPSSVRSAEPLEAVTWICPRQAPPPPRDVASMEAAVALAAAVSSDLTREGGAPAVLPAPRITRAGDCYRVGHTISDTLAPGAYTYTIHWKSRPSSRPRTAEARFTVE